MAAKVVIGVDHGGLHIKNVIIEHLEQRGFEVKDVGVFSEESADYPDKAVDAVKEFRRGGYDFGVVCCGTGIGISISANKMKGITCAMPQNSFAAQMAREHNNVNFIAFGGRIDYTEPIEKILDSFIDAEFAGGRHLRRVKKMNNLEI
ncbi:MAG: ribose 5-phosphate isomerase B [Spirochaetia bacterium]|nr:ribose 5-phosphate isomerase B [Spirochaetia bacterium]